MVLNLAEGRAEIRMARPTDGRNDVLLSLLVRRGAFFADPLLGCRMHEVRKLSSSSVGAARKYCEEALQWLLDTGKARAMTIVTERAPQQRSRLNCRIEVTWANGQRSDYTVHREVV